MTDQPRPPVRERLDFEEIDVTGGIAGGRVISVLGTQPDDWSVEIEDDPDPSIPEPEWIRWELVGYHFGEFVPNPQPFTVRRGTDELPPGAMGVESSARAAARRFACADAAAVSP